jgi:starch synthase
MVKKLKVLFVSAECSPYASTGGLGDVSAALPKALYDSGTMVRRAIPMYADVHGDFKYCADFPVKMGPNYQGCIIKHDTAQKVPTYFIGNEYYFNRDKLYGYYDDGERFAFFCKAVIRMLEHIPFKPDIIHCNDWHTALIPLILKSINSDIKSVFTIHNLKYTGSIPMQYMEEYNMSLERLPQCGYPDNIDFMKSGILNSDHITTVSNGYREEVLTPQYGERLDNLLLQRKNSFTGILNGIDTQNYDPKNARIPYDIDNLNAKNENKALLREELGLEDEDVPIVASITRLDDQKGIDLIINAIRKIDIQGFQFVILGTGNQYYENTLSEMASMYPGKMAAIFAFDTELAKRIYAGADIFIMPSKFEPGGLGQLYAMAYGTVPVVRSTGGLKDTVADAEGTDNPVGFSFKSYTVNSFIEALKRAIDAYNTPMWEKLMKNGMALEKSWGFPASQYIKIYKSLCDYHS